LAHFQHCQAVDDIILAVPEDYRSFVALEVVDRYGFSKVSQLVIGGEERQDSVYEALQAVDKSSEIVVVHDGVRPFVKPETIEGSIELCRKEGAVVVAVPVVFTVKEVEQGKVVRTLDRSRIWEVQTPQTFRYPLLMEAYRRAYQDGYRATDDAALVERLGHPVAVLEGDRWNIKITTPEDLKLAEWILSKGGECE